MKYGGGFLYNLVFTEWRHCVSQNEVWGRGCYITLFSPSDVTAFHRIVYQYWHIRCSFLHITCGLTLAGCETWNTACLRPKQHPRHVWAAEVKDYVTSITVLTGWNRMVIIPVSRYCSVIAVFSHRYSRKCKISLQGLCWLEVFLWRKCLSILVIFEESEECRTFTYLLIYYMQQETNTQFEIIYQRSCDHYSCNKEM